MRDKYLVKCKIVDIHPQFTEGDKGELVEGSIVFWFTKLNKNITVFDPRFHEDYSILKIGDDVLVEFGNFYSISKSSTKEKKIKLNDAYTLIEGFGQILEISTDYIIIDVGIPLFAYNPKGKFQIGDFVKIDGGLRASKIKKLVDSK